MLGSGLSHLAEDVTEASRVDFADVPGLPAATVQGHAGSFMGGRLGSVPVLLQAGRFHLYEGHAPEVVVAPVRIMAALGIEVVILTNAAGGIRADTTPGDLLLLDDHINMTFIAPLAGPVAAGEERFPDMSAPYDPRLQELARDAAAESGVALSRGVYAAVLGPAYETAAEVRMLGLLGADVVGMSTVPEVIAARAAGLRCVGFSMVTNKATGLSGEEIQHADVLEIGADAGRRLGRVIVALLVKIEAAGDLEVAVADGDPPTGATGDQSTGAK